MCSILQLLGIWAEVIRLVLCKHCDRFFHYDIYIVNVFNVYDPYIGYIFPNNIYDVYIVNVYSGV